MICVLVTQGDTAKIASVPAVVHGKVECAYRISAPCPTKGLKWEGEQALEEAVKFLEMAKAESLLPT